MAPAHDPAEITPDLLLKAYASGIFPMSDDASDPELFWVEPNERGILPLDGLIVSRRLARTVRSDRFSVRVDQDFELIIDGCAAPKPDRTSTWINARIRLLYGELFKRGYCHTVEVYQDNELVGGLYGVALGGAFFGESMFHRATDASKTALVHLVARLRMGGVSLLDTQFVTGHLETLGAIEILRQDYKQRLKEALKQQGNFLVWPKDVEISGRQVLAVLNV